MKNVILGLMIIIVVGSIVGLIKVNKWIQGEVGDIVQVNEVLKVESESAQATKNAEPQRKTGEVICKIRLAPERSHEELTFYQGGEEIAKHNVSIKGMVFDQFGNIPDGKVKFINETNKTYGVMYFKDNLRNGPSRTNYNSGQLKIEANYFYGKLMTRKEYYIDGVLKMEEDYSDARKLMNDRETGAGKVYWRDGKIKFEWYMVDSDPVGYYKSYNVKGGLKSAIYFDEYNNELPPQDNITITSSISKPVPAPQ